MSALKCFVTRLGNLLVISVLRTSSQVVGLPTLFYLCQLPINRLRHMRRSNEPSVRGVGVELTIRARS